MKRVLVVFVLFAAACDVQAGDQMVDPMPFSTRQHGVIGKPITPQPTPSVEEKRMRRIKRQAESGY